MYKAGVLAKLDIEHADTAKHARSKNGNKLLSKLADDQCMLSRPFVTAAS